MNTKPNTPLPAGDSRPPAPLADADNSGPITKTVAVELWNLFNRHKLSYEQAINVMVATTKMIGRKSCNDEAGAFCMFLDKALKICPELKDIAGIPD